MVLSVGGRERGGERRGRMKSTGVTDREVNVRIRGECLGRCEHNVIMDVEGCRPWAGRAVRRPGAGEVDSERKRIVRAASRDVKRKTEEGVRGGEGRGEIGESEVNEA